MIQPTFDAMVNFSMLNATLTAEEALALYPFRWKIERVFFDLKETLNLNKFYTHGAQLNRR